MKHRKNKHPQSSPSEVITDPKTIEHRAYELFEERGSEPGYELLDWLRAEDELRVSS